MPGPQRDPLQDPQPGDEFEIAKPGDPARIRVLPGDPNIVAFYDLDHPEKPVGTPLWAWRSKIAPIARWLSPIDRKRLDDLKPYLAELHAVRERFKAMSYAECKAAELAQLHEFWRVRPDAPGLLELIQRLEAEPPSATSQERAFEGMKGLVLCFSSTHSPPSDLRKALDGYLSAKPVMTEVLLTADVLPSTWS